MAVSLDDLLKADKRAFVALMAHLKKIDGDKRTVLMVQVENESGTYGLVRDFAPAAGRLSGRRERIRSEAITSSASPANGALMNSLAMSPGW